MYYLHEAFYEYPILSGLQLLFTIWMAIDAYRRGVEQFWVWIIIIFQPLGAWIYFFAIKFRTLEWNLGGLFPSGPSLGELRYRVDQAPTLTNELALAQHLVQKHEYAEAQTLLESAHKKEPEHCQVLYCLAQCQFGQDRPEEAVRLLKEIIQREPRWADYSAWRLLIEVKEELNQHESALENARQLVKLSPTIRHKCIFAEQLHGLNQTQEAQVLLEKAIQEQTYVTGPIRRINRPWVRQAKRLLSQFTSSRP